MIVREIETEVAARNLKLLDGIFVRFSIVNRVRAGLESCVRRQCAESVCERRQPRQTRSMISKRGSNSHSGPIYQAYKAPTP